MDQQQRPRWRRTIEQFLRWRPTRRQILWASGIAALAFLAIVICGYLFDWQWTGLGPSKVNNGQIQPAKTLWDWLGLLIVPVVLAIGGYLFNSAQNRATQEAAERRAQDEALQAYLDQVGELLLDKESPLREPKANVEALILTRARTLTVMERLDPKGRRHVLNFLIMSQLIFSTDTRRAVLALDESNLSGVDMFAISLPGAYLSSADLSDADLSGVKGITNERWDSPISTDSFTLRDVGFSYSILLKVRGTPVAQR